MYERMGKITCFQCSKYSFRIRSERISFSKHTDIHVKKKISLRYTYYLPLIKYWD